MAKPSSGTSHCIQSCDHIRKLPNSDDALRLLHELKCHVDPILAARKWRVQKLYEVCCCTAGGKNTSVGGFCVAACDGSTALRIALRLRTPKSHSLYPFEHCLATLLHELSHIVHQASAERALKVLSVKGIRVDK